MVVIDLANEINLLSSSSNICQTLYNIYQFDELLYSLISFAQSVTAIRGFSK